MAAFFLKQRSQPSEPGFPLIARGKQQWSGSSLQRSGFYWPSH